MRGRIASFAIGASVAKHRTQAAMTQQQQQAQQAQQAQQTEQTQQQEIEQLKAAQAAPSQQVPQQEDVTQKLKKFADLHKQGILTDEEFQKMKAELIAKL
jgi:hypothetical protein